VKPGPYPYWTPRLPLVPEIPDTPLPACNSLTAPGGGQDDETEIAYYIIPRAHDMPEEHFRLHVRLRHEVMMRGRGAMYSRIRHDQIHKNCPPSWFNHKHKDPA
jgi:hypothetical protein